MQKKEKERKKERNSVRIFIRGENSTATVVATRTNFLAVAIAHKTATTNISPSSVIASMLAC